MIERERTFLARAIPEAVRACPSKEIIDIYIPRSSDHPVLRIRKSGGVYEMTKKTPLSGNDSSEQLEETIRLSKEEFDALAKIESKKSRKIRYYFPWRGRTAEIAVFKDALEGLVLIDFEFETSKDKEAFQMPDFCLADVTQEKFLAGGALAGKRYENIEKDVGKYGYKKLFLG